MTGECAHATNEQYITMRIELITSNHAVCAIVGVARLRASKTLAGGGDHGSDLLARQVPPVGLEVPSIGTSAEPMSVPVLLDLVEEGRAWFLGGAQKFHREIAGISIRSMVKSSGKGDRVSK